MSERFFLGAVLPDAPAAVPARPARRTLHGVEIVDDYAWIRAENWREVLRDPKTLPPEIRAVLDAENRYAAAVMAPSRALQKRLKAEMRGRMEEEDADVPIADGPFEYYDRYREDGQHELVCRIPRGGGAESILLDGDTLAEGHEFFELGGATPSDDHALLAWGADLKGSELHVIKVRDLATGVDRNDARARYRRATRSGPRPATPSSTSSSTRTCAPAACGCTGSAREASEDRLIYAEPDPTWFISIERTRSGRFAVLSIQGHDASEARVIERSAPLDPPRTIEPRAAGIRYALDHRGDSFVILTNADAVDFRVVTAPVSAPGRSQWRDLVPHRPGRLIVACMALTHHIVRLEREEALPRIVIREAETGAETTISFPEEAYALGLGEVAEQDTDVMRFSYSSMTTPEEVYDYDLRTSERTLRKRQIVPSGHDPAAYVTRRIFATSPDGATIPVSVLHRRGLVLDGSAPLLLYGYGAYGHSVPAAFGTKRLSLVDRGFVYALAHVRGGTEKGWAWYTDGKLANKRNSFADFVAAGRALVEAGFTSERRIVAQGGSAGGLLMGAVANLAPDLFAGIIADVPFVDVLNTILDDQLPLTPPEWLEWGNPILDPEAFAAIRAYSPYDNVAPRRYPPILALGGLTDPRVTYWEPAKWVARLRATTLDPLVMLKTNMDAGHGGASGRYDSLDEVALEYAFALACVGLAGA